MMHEHTVNLLDQLLAATQNGRIEWKEEEGKGGYNYLAGDVTVEIDANADGASFCLTDTKGKTVESAKADELSAATLTAGGTALSAVKAIHAIAARQNSGADNAISSVLDHLQGLDAGDDEQDAAEEATVKEDQAETAEEETSAEEAPEIDSGEVSEEVTGSDDDAHQESAPMETAAEEDVPPFEEGGAVIEPLIEEAPAGKKKKKKGGFSLFGKKKR